VTWPGQQRAPFEGLDVGPAALIEAHGRRWLVRQFKGGLVAFDWTAGAWILASVVPAGLLETARVMLADAGTLRHVDLDFAIVADSAAE
jgi:hypothetical protein